jgi:hypothetical protein
MRNIVFVFTLLLISCSSSVKKENMQGVKDVEKVESNNIDTNSLVCNRFEINEYEKKANSLIGEILGGNINPKMTTDTLKKEEVIFVELKNTPLSQLATENEIIKYTFSLTGKYSLLKHHFIRIICKDEISKIPIFMIILARNRNLRSILKQKVL